MALFRKDIFYYLNLSIIFFSALIVSGAGGGIQIVSAAVPTDSASCLAASGICMKKYNSYGFTIGMGCPASKSVESGMCRVATPSEVEKDVTEKCCIPAPPAAITSSSGISTAAACAAADGTCSPGDGNCNKSPFSTLTTDLLGYCDGATASSSCCKLKVVATDTGADTVVGADTGAGACASPKVCRSDCQSGETSVSICSSGLKCCATQSTAQTSSPQAINFTNPLAFNTVEEVLTSILGTLRGIIVILALVFIVIGAVLYITSAGNEGQMTLAKGAITAAMIGLALGIAAPSFLKEIGTVLGWGAVNAGPAASALTLSQIARNVLNFLLSIVGILGIIMLVIGGIMYLTAAGDEDRIETGKKIVTYSIIGILVALASLVIVAQIAAFFG